MPYLPTVSDATDGFLGVFYYSVLTVSKSLNALLNLSLESFGITDSGTVLGHFTCLIADINKSQVLMTRQSLNIVTNYWLSFRQFSM